MVKIFTDIKNAVKSKKAFGFVDSGVKILIAVVVGSSLLGGTYTLYDKVIMPSTQSKVETLFDYDGKDSSASSGGSESSESTSSETEDKEEENKKTPVVAPEPIDPNEPQPYPCA